MRGLATAHLNGGMTLVFLITTVLSGVTGFMFPFVKLLPAHVVGVVSLVALAVTILALYAFRLAGIWRTAFAAGAVLSQYLNVFVLVAQIFRRVPALHALAPTESEPPFL